MGRLAGQWEGEVFRYTIVYKLYGLFIYSISYVCIYMNICIRREGLFFVLFLSELRWCIKSDGCALRFLLLTRLAFLKIYDFLIFMKFA